MSRTASQALQRLAELYDIQRSYDGFDAQRHIASPDTLLALLQARGAPLTGLADVHDALRERTEELSCDGIAPVLVSWGGRMSAIPLRIAGVAAKRKLRYTIRFEDGTVRSAEAKAEALPRPGTRAGSATHRIRGIGAIPTGYHDIEVETSTGSFASRIFSAPRHAFAPALQADWGVFAPLYALRNTNDPGIGNFTDLETLARWTAARGGSFVGTLPLLASYVDVMFEPSPYSPVSRLFWNELFIDVTRAPGWSHNLPELTPSADPSVVDYRAAGATKLRALRAAAAAYHASGDTSALDRFTASHEQLRDYARFRAVLDRRRVAWRDWPERLRNGHIDDGEFAVEDEQFHRYVQWVAEEQLGAIASASQHDSAGLYLDLPLGVNPDGYDAWRERDLFAENVTTGAPPDPLFTGGQDWGFRPPDPDAERRTGHRYFINSLRSHMRHAQMLRMDHVMALYRLYWIPRGGSAGEGAYVRYPADELFAAVAIESNRNRTTVVGEDLGTVPREVRQMMQKRRVIRMYVVQYEVSAHAEDPIAVVPRDVVASINTHDMPTFRGFLLGAELKDQLDLGLVDKDRFADDLGARNHLVQRLAARFGDATSSAELMRRVLHYLAASRAYGVVINLEDLWLEERPQNVPGTSTERENWKRRMGLTLDQIMADPDITALLSMIDRTRCADARAAVAQGPQ